MGAAGAGAAAPAEGRMVDPNRSSMTVLKKRFLEDEVRRRAFGANDAAMTFEVNVCAVDRQAASE